MTNRSCRRSSTRFSRNIISFFSDCAGRRKSRIIRQLTDLLDEEIPIIAGSEINDDPFAPLSAYGRQQIELHGDETKIDWVHRDNRFVEKLATPDVTIADIIGDVDPIKAAKGGHLLSDELTIHFGLLPRANRGIFAINELPDLAGKIQVGLFNIMQEGDVQIKGYPVRLPLDVMLVFQRESGRLHGSRKDHHAAQRPHRRGNADALSGECSARAPRSRNRKRGRSATDLKVSRSRFPILLPRRSSRSRSKRATINASTSVAAFRSDSRSRRSNRRFRMPNAVRLITGETEIVPRISDIYAALPAMTGKMELEYEGEQIGANASRERSDQTRVRRDFRRLFSRDRFRADGHWFDEGNKFLLSDTASAEECVVLARQRSRI